MQVLKQLLNFYINSSIHVGLAAFALTWVTLIQFELEYDANVLYFVFYASVTGYNFVKYFGVAKFHHRSLAGWLKAIQILSFVAFLALIYYAFMLKISTLILITLLGLITFLYAIPILPQKYFIDDQKNLRQISGLKVYVIALVWTFATVIVPLINNDVEINTDVIIVSVQRFCYVLVLMLPFEIRDLNYDSLKLSTIPQKIGIKKTKLIGVFLLMLFFMLDYFKDELIGFEILATLIITFITLLFLLFSNKNQSKYYSAFWVESLPIVWLCILLMFA